MKTSVTTNEAPAAIGPYSQGVRHGDLLWCSGALGLDPNSGKMVEGGVAAEAEQALNNLEAICREGGTSLDKAVRCTVYLVDLADFKTVNEIYARRFEEPFPARACVQVSALPAGGLVEIDAIVALKLRQAVRQQTFLLSHQKADGSIPFCLICCRSYSVTALVTACSPSKASRRFFRVMRLIPSSSAARN